MLIERYDSLLKGKGVASDGEALLGDEINARKAFFRHMGMSNGSGSKRYRGGSYRQGNIHSNRPISQRVLVKIHFKRHKPGGAGSSGGAGNLRGHLSYITRDGAGIDEERPTLFGSVGDDIDRVGFYHLCEEDRHHFRFIISPENGHEIADMEGYICGVMGAVEKDLDTKLEWVCAIHYDTDNPHAHVVVRGRDDLGKDLVIAPDYISNGIRMRAEELATEILGERSIEEIQRSMEKETGAMRVTSLDRFIVGRAGEQEKEAGEIVVDTREAGFTGRGDFYDGLVQKRLEFLTTTAMAVQRPPGVFKVGLGYTSELREVSERQDIIKQLHRIMPEEEHGVSIYDASKDGALVVGRIEKIAHINELTDHRYMVVRDGNEQAHYVPLAMSDRNDALLEGMIVEVSAGKATGKADKNIAFIAGENNGVYTREAHLDYVRCEMEFIEDPEGYVDYHGVRLQTLEKAEIVEQGEGGYVVPEDLEERGAELNRELEKSGWKKKAYAKVKALCTKPIANQIDVRARTFLDLEIYRDQKGYDLSYEKADKGTMEAFSKRKDWLAENGYGHYREVDGRFVIKGDALGKLYGEELQGSGRKLSCVLNKRYVQRDIEEKTMMRYVGYADMHGGRHVILSGGDEFTFVKMPRGLGKVRKNEPVEVEKTEAGLSISTNRRDITRDEAIALAKEKSGLGYKDLDTKDVVSATFLGAVNLEEGVYAVVEHEEEISFVKVKDYPEFNNNSEIEIGYGEGGFAEITEADQQRELEFDPEHSKELEEDIDIDIDW